MLSVLTKRIYSFNDRSNIYLYGSKTFNPSSFLFAMKIVAIFAVLRANDANIDYDKVSNSTIKSWANSMLKDGFYDEETFKELRAKERTMKIKTVDEISKTTDIYFHRIIGIYMADDGTIFYKTEGDTNHDSTGPDALLIAESLVVGEYLYTPPLIRDVFHFLSTSMGMLLLVVVPLGILMLFMSFSIIEQISRMGIEKRVLRRELAYDDPESLKANIGIEMEMSDKVKFFATAGEEERNAVSYFLWGYLGKNKEEELTYQGIMHALTYLDEDPNKYWMYFVGLAKTKRQKKLMHKVWQEWIQEEKIKALTKKPKQAEEQKPVKAGKIIEGKQAPKRPQRSEE